MNFLILGVLLCLVGTLITSFEVLAGKLRLFPFFFLGSVILLVALIVGVFLRLFGVI